MYDDLESSVQEQGFFSGALSRVQGILQPISSFTQSPAGTSLMNAIYQYGAGRVERARESYVNSFLQTREGQRAQAEGIRQTAMQYWPAVVAVLLVVLFIGMRLKRG